MKKNLIFLLALIFLIPASQAVAQKKVRIAYVEWACATASSYLAKEVIESRLGYEVELLPVTAAAMWMSLASGDADCMVTAWLPVTHADYVKRTKGRVQDMGVVVGGARLGWAVPDYVPITSIEELKANKDKFKKRIVGIDPGAGIMKLSEKAMKQYGLDDMVLVEGSDATMTAELKDAIRKKEWIVFTTWSPHWMFGRWDLHYLDDPQKALGEEEEIKTFARNGLEKDMPELYAFLKNFHYDDTKQLQTLMAWNQENGKTEENVKRFIREHPQLVDSWLKK